MRQLQGAADSLPRVAAIQGASVNARIRAELEPRFSDRVHFFDSIGPTGKVILTITAANASKGAALEAACRYLELSPREVVAFGDADNDVEMFRVAGASVAMGQAEASRQSDGNRGDIAQRRGRRRARHRKIVGERARGLAANPVISGSAAEPSVNLCWPPARCGRGRAVFLHAFVHASSTNRRSASLRREHYVPLAMRTAGWKCAPAGPG